MERRVKKRPSFGVRTVELTRGQHGFGFTLSGQAPCILSSIVQESPAAKANLKSGDFVIAVNGKNVAKSLHDDVVDIIGNSTGLLKLQIAENYLSSSSDEEEEDEAKMPSWSQHLSDNEEYTMQPAPSVPRQLKPIHFRGNSADSTLTENSELHLAIGGAKPKRISPRKKAGAKLRSQPQKLELGGGDELMLTQSEINAFLHPTLNELRRSIKLQNRESCQGLDLGDAVFKCVVGYLGTIEMPRDKQVGLQAIQGCIRRLRVEKKVHTVVLMAIFANKTILINHHGLKLAEYPANQVSKTCSLRFQNFFR